MGEAPGEARGKHPQLRRVHRAARRAAATRDAARQPLPCEQLEVLVPLVLLLFCSYSALVPNAHERADGLPDRKTDDAERSHCACVAQLDVVDQLDADGTIKETVGGQQQS